MGFFKWSAGISEVFKPSAGLLPGDLAKTGWKLAQAFPIKAAVDLEFGSVVETELVGTVTVVKPKAATTDTLQAAETMEIFGIALRDAVGQQTRVIGTTMINAYPRNYNATIVKKGYVTVPVQAGTPAVGGDVWVKVKANSTKTYLPVGGIEAAQDTTGTTGSEVYYNRKASNAKFETVGTYPLNYAGVASATNETGMVAVIFLD